MKPEHVSYREATRVSLGGLALQVALGLGLLIYSIYGQDHAGRTAALYVLLGSAVWLTLALVFDQHRRERIEAMETEALAEAGGSASSVFTTAAGEFRIAARRLSGMHRFLVPAVSLAFGAALIGLGVWRFNTGAQLADPDQFSALPHSGWAIVIGLTTALTGFLFARFVSGMAQQPVWANLEAGATVAVGSALFGAALAIGHFALFAGTSAVARLLPGAMPLALIVLGAEVVLNFLLELYRPRKTGEVPRAAFESRLLGFVAAPDRVAQSIGEAISYQLGRDVTTSWLYRLLGRAWWKLALFGLAIGWLLTSLAVVHPHQQGMILRFGRLRAASVGPGLHVKWPWPIERLEVPEYVAQDGSAARTARTVTGVRTLHVGSAPEASDAPMLWTERHVADEAYMIVRAGARPGERGAGSEGGVALVAVEVPIHYAIADVYAFDQLAAPGHREPLLRAVAEREAMAYFASLTLDEVLAGRRGDMAAELRRRLSDAFARLGPMTDHGPLGAGVEILAVGTHGIHPPTGSGVELDVARSFERVIVAQQKTAAAVLNARAHAVETLASVAGSVELAEQIIAALDALEQVRRVGASPTTIDAQRLEVQRLIEQAGGRAATLIHQARAERWQRHMGERARLARYVGQIGSYLASPALYLSTLYFEALRDAMAGARVFVTDGVQLRLRFDAQSRETGFDVFRPEESTQP